MSNTVTPFCVRAGCGKHIVDRKVVRETRELEVYYSGDARPVGREAGHYLHDRQMRHACWNPRFDRLARLPRDFPIENPWSLDAGFAPQGEEVEGLALVHHLSGWTILAFWDRSGDQRRGSNSAFVIRGELSFIEAVEAAREAFPKIWARFDFGVTEDTGG